MDQEKKVHEQLAFIHQILTQSTKYFANEFEIAKDAIALITDMANKLADKIRADEAAKAADEGELHEQE